MFMGSVVLSMCSVSCAQYFAESGMKRVYVERVCLSVPMYIISSRYD